MLLPCDWLIRSGVTRDAPVCRAYKPILHVRCVILCDGTVACSGLQRTIYASYTTTSLQYDTLRCLTSSPSLVPDMCSVLICFSAGTVGELREILDKEYRTSAECPVSTTCRTRKIKSVLLY